MSEIYGCGGNGEPCQPPFCPRCISPRRKDMTDNNWPDPIRAALEKAVMQRCAAINDRCHCQDTGALNRAACADAVHGMADDWAAFLRAVPMMLNLELHSSEMGDESYPDFDAIADAVLAAAKDQTND
jgi:hypothetical protein